MREKRNASRCLISQLSEVNCLENLGAEGRIIFKVSLRKLYGGMWHIGVRGGVVVKELHHKPAGRGFDSDGVIGIFQ
jgi:hypothetical protein